MNDKTRWVKDYVSTLEWEWFTDVPTAHFWEYCRLKANTENKNWQEKSIKRGSFISSVSHMSVETGLTEKQVRLAINKLERTGEITTERTNKYTLINVVKYADYQSSYSREGKQKVKQEGIPQGEPQGNQRATILDIESIENIENKENTKESLDCSPEMAEALEAFEKMRKRIRKPLTEEAKPMILKKLSKMAMDEETQIAILNQSTMNSWQGLFPLQDTQKNVHNEKKGLEALMNL